MVLTPTGAAENQLAESDFLFENFQMNKNW